MRTENSGNNKVISFSTIPDTAAPFLVFENISNPYRPDFFSDIDLKGFKIDGQFKLAFNEKVLPGDGAVVISNGTETRIVQIDDASQVTFDESGGVTIDLKNDLIAGTTYQVRMAKGVIVDTAGNDFVGLDVTSKMVKTSEPVLTFSNVSRETAGYDSEGSFFQFIADDLVIKADDKIVLGFDEKVIAGSGDIIFSNGVDTVTIPITDTRQVIFEESGSDEYARVVIDPIDDLTPGTTYHVWMDKGVIKDTAGNPFAGGSVNLKIIDSAPLLIDSNPSNRSVFKIDGSADGKIKLTFDEPVMAGHGDLVLSNGKDERFIAIDDTSQVTFDRSGEVTIDLTEDLIADTTYTAQMASGVITDTAGNPYAGFNNATFKTVMSNPLMTGKLALPGTFDGVLLFDEPVKANSGDVIITGERVVNSLSLFLSHEIRTEIVSIPINDSSQIGFNLYPYTTDSVTITPHLAPRFSFNHFSIVKIENGAITDFDGNPFRGFNQTGSAENSTGPILLASIPASGSVIKTDDDIRLIFNEKVVPGHGDIIFSNGTDTRTVPINDASQVIFDALGNVFVNPHDDLLVDTTYTVSLTNGAILDMAGNSFAGFSNGQIKVVDSAPLLLGSNALNYGIFGTDNIPSLNRFSFISDDGRFFRADETISFYFDEKVKAGKGDLILSSGTDTRIVAIDDTSQVFFDEFGGVSIDLTEALIPDTTYNVLIPNGVITDISGNTYAGLSYAAIKTIKPVDATKLNPLLYSVKVGDAIELDFMEKVVPGSGDIFISSGTDTRIIAINDTSQVTFDDSGIVIIDPAQDLLKNTNYEMHIEHGAIVDTDGNPFEAPSYLSSANAEVIPIFDLTDYESNADNLNLDGVIYTSTGVLLY
ncbi:MAG: Ig-like domain-containing protein [Nitrosomonas sp.]|nr:Ig-like domain-containing protein [Nitrosomonas sp.]